MADCRDHLGWTQPKLAVQASLSVTFISEIENDRRTPGTDALLSLAEALGVSLDYLVKGVTPNSTAPRPLVIPPNLLAAAEEEGWSVGAASDLLKARQMVVARRSKDGEGDERQRELTKAEWKEFYQNFFEADRNGPPRK